MPSPALLRERERYAALVAAMEIPDPTALVASGGAERRLSVRDLARHWQGAVSRAGEGAAWNFYVHVPYCKSLCTFCNYQRLRVSSADALDDYVGFMVSEAAHLGPALDGARFGSLFVGGGTPSVLNAPRLEALLDGLHRAFRFEDEAQKTFEYDPMVMTDDRFSVLARFGFQRYTFGIQSTDVAVNQRHDRGAQGRWHVDRQFELLARHGARSTNVDFLLGLVGTTPDGMAREIDDVVSRHRPHEVSVYFLWPTAPYVAAHYGGDFAAFERFLAGFERLVPGALAEMAERRGYDLDPGKHILKLHLRKGREVKEQVFGYNDISSQAHRPLYLLGLGDSARSRIFSTLRYRAEHDTADRDPDSPRYLGAEVSMEDEVWSYVSHTFRDGESLSRPLFRRTFGRDVTELCADPLTKLEALGAVVVTEDAVVLGARERRARLCDTLFFAPAGAVVRPAPRRPPANGGPTAAIAREEVARLLLPLSDQGTVAAGWTIETIGAGRLELAGGEVRLRVRLLAPAGAHPACRTTARYDLQYDVLAGRPASGVLDAPLDAIAAAIRRNEV